MGKLSHNQASVERSNRIHALWMEGKSVYQIAEAEKTSASNATTYILRARKLGLCPTRERKVAPLPPRGTSFTNYILPPGLKMFAQYKGHPFEAEITKSGVHVPGLGDFDSLSLAAMSCVKKRIGINRNLNGWEFWRVLLVNGQECFMSNFRTDPTLIDQVQVHKIAPTRKHQALDQSLPGLLTALKELLNFAREYGPSERASIEDWSDYFTAADAAIAEYEKSKSSHP